ncbi:MAG: DUF302 domain-containing protein [Rhodospirillales bacterium]|nr:DUF302 domain-containing protein [Rhodospirillales bacterium]
MRIVMMVVCGLLMTMPVALPVAAENPAYPKDVQVVETGQPFLAYLDKLKTAIGANKMGIVGLACATCGARNIGITIPENRVVMIFNPHFAVRMLKASVPAGVEAPLRLYLAEQADGTAVLSYKWASQVFAPYGNADLDIMAGELDLIITAIVAAAAK